MKNKVIETISEQLAIISNRISNRKLVIELPKIIRNRFGMVFETMPKSLLPMQAKQVKQNGFALK